MKHIFLLIIGMIVSSCVIPMPIELDESEANYAPNFDPAWVQPTPAMIIEYDPVINRESILEFDSGPLTDPNQADTLFWRVFLNYQGRFYNAIYRSNQGGGISLSQRDEGIQFSVDPCLDFKLFTFDGPYRVELIVSDRPFLQDVDEDRLINQILANDAMSFKIHWFINFPQELCLI